LTDKIKKIESHIDSDSATTHYKDRKEESLILLLGVVTFQLKSGSASLLAFLSACPYFVSQAAMDPIAQYRSTFSGIATSLPAGSSEPPLLQTLKVLFNPLANLDHLLKEYGHVFTVRLLGFPPAVFVCNSRALEQIFSAKPNTFVSGNPFLESLLGQKSLLLLNSSMHERHRKLMMPPFHGDRMRAYGEIIRDVTEAVFNQFTTNQIFVAREAMQEISLRVILKAVLGIQEGEKFDIFRSEIASLLDIMGSPVVSRLLFVPSLQKDFGKWTPWGKFMAQKQRVDQLLYDEIQLRQSNISAQGNDIFTLLVSARDEDGNPMSGEELHDELMTLLVAGHETLASALSWALYHIHLTSETTDVRAKLITEIQEPIHLSLSDIVKLPYLNAVCQETLRINPVVLFSTPRITITDFQLLDYKFSPGTVIMPCIYLTHRREDLYPNPSLFTPERFLSRQFSQYEFLPFGGGNRSCIGSSFALYEMKIVLATILSNFKVSLLNQKHYKPVRRIITFTTPATLKFRFLGQIQ
jgi:cytochrome P450 family 110